jgi:methylthioribulose-1-phosphate dehydratase
MTASLQDAIPPIVAAGNFLHAQGLAPATSGNYSLRLGDGNIAITVSGAHKGRLTDSDVMLIAADGTPLENKRPSAETLLHTQIYDLFPTARAILHVHSRPGVVLTRVMRGNAIVLQGCEMLKAFPGIHTHATSIALPVFDNSQDMQALSQEVAQRIRADLPAYLIREHGFYVWGQDMPAAERSAEALEFLLWCELQTLQAQTGARA